MMPAPTSQGQQFALKAALHLWAWLDIQCYNWGKEVRKQGGLWVVGTSVQVGSWSPIMRSRQLQ
jgi:hypothetical protein